MSSSSIRSYLQGTFTQILSGIISTFLGSIIIFIWKASPWIVFTVVALIVFITILITSIRALKRVPFKMIFSIGVIILLVSEISVGLLLGKQLTTSPDIVELAPSKGKDVITDSQLVGKFYNANCGAQEEIITFQEPPAGQYMMKNSRVTAIVGTPKLEIDNPIANEKVGFRYVFRGKSCGIAKSDLKIYVLIHPLETDRWWVQYPTTIDSNGDWSARGQFAETTGQAVEEEFEVIAIATISKLKIGHKSVEIPRHIVHSKIVTTLKTRL